MCQKIFIKDVTPEKISQLIKYELYLQGININQWVAYECIKVCLECKSKLQVFYNLDDQIVNKIEFKSNENQCKIHNCIIEYGKVQGETIYRFNRRNRDEYLQFLLQLYNNMVTNDNNNINNLCKYLINKFDLSNKK